MIRGPERVLLVDDHAGFRATARRMLEADGFDVVGEAADGPAALAAIAALRPDVVLLDVGLPGMDGFEVAEHANDSDPCAIILISSRDAEGYADRLARSPVLGFIGKGDLDGDRVRSVLDGAAS